MVVGLTPLWHAWQSLAEEGRLEEALAQLLGASAEAEQALTLAKGNPRAGGDPTDERDLTSFLAGIHRDLVHASPRA